MHLKEKQIKRNEYKLKSNNTLKIAFGLGNSIESIKVWEAWIIDFG